MKQNDERNILKTVLMMLLSIIGLAVLAAVIVRIFGEDS